MDRQQYKEVGLIIANTLYSAVIFGVISSVSISTTAPIYLSLTALVILIWVAGLAFTLALMAHNGMVALIAILIPTILILIGKLHPGAIAAAFMMAILIIIIRSKIISEGENLIKFNVFQVFYGSTKLLVLTILIAIAGLNISSLVTEIKADGVKIPVQTIESYLSPLDSIINIPFSASSSIDDIIEKQVQQKLAGLPPGTKLPPEQINQLRQQISGQVGQTLTGQETLITVAINRINDQLIRLTRINPVISALVIIIIILGILRLFIPVLAWPILGIIAVFILIAQKTGFAYLHNFNETVVHLKL